MNIKVTPIRKSYIYIFLPYLVHFLILSQTIEYKMEYKNLNFSQKLCSAALNYGCV